MRILLDEDLPRHLGSLLTGHETPTVQRCGWSGVKNGKLLALAATRFEVFLPMDGNLEFQQNLATLPIAVLVIEAVSNRMQHLTPLVPSILNGLNHIPPKSLQRVGAYLLDRVDLHRQGASAARLSCFASIRKWFEQHGVVP